MEIVRLHSNDGAIAKQVLENFTAVPGQPNVLPSSDHLTSLLGKQNCYVLAALDNETITGFTLAYSFPSFYASENTAYLYDIEVLPAYRNRGVGRALIRELLKVLRTDDVKEVWLGTGSGNLPAQRLFHSTGAQREDETFYEYFYYLD